MKFKKVVLLTGEGVSSLGAGEIWHFFDKELEYPVSLVYANDISRINWQETDVIIMPDGNYRFMSDKTSSDQLRDWISKGGKVVALESGSYNLQISYMSAVTRNFRLSVNDSLVMTLGVVVVSSMSLLKVADVAPA